MPADRANVSIPEEVADIFRWMVKYDPAFNGSSAAVAAYLIKVGAKVVYAESLSQAEPLPDGLVAEFAESSRRALDEAVKADDHEETRAPKGGPRHVGARG